MFSMLRSKNGGNKMSVMGAIYLELTTGVADVNEKLEQAFEQENGTFETLDLAFCQSIIKLVEMRNYLKEIGAVK